MTLKLLQPLLTKIQKELQRHADPSTKAWSDAYLKGLIEHRGLKAPAVEKLIFQLWNENALERLPPQSQWKLAASLIKSRYSEDKFSGIIMIQKHLLDRIPTPELLKKIEALFRQGDFFCWSITDWVSTRVLDPLICQSDHSIAKRVASWCQAEDFWQRRASAVSFRGSVAIRSNRPLIEKMIRTLVMSNERFHQTGIGWLIASIAKHDHDWASTLVEQHFQKLSREVIDRHTKSLRHHRKLQVRKRLPC